MAYRLTYDELEARWRDASPSPTDDGAVELIVRRPVPEEREELQRANFSAEAGLEGDDWLRRSGDPDAQITLMNSRVVHLLAGDKARWAEAGDQLFVDLELSEDNLPPGTRLQIGSVLMEVSPLPHTGCNKFARRFGVPARKWVMSDEGKRARRRGMYTRVVQDGEIAVGDRIRKV
ncbi:MAG: MOSC domain-containing protein [Chloroflexota bacterium]|nr:MOSC domain-containing protein [Chloroflexota bacterium]MCY3582177.1 MOSC domain-containing protein [Chloroflexota bacterium]MDE2649941.1 MOSC domain-containing protein [Chloroflexota bacterium]MXX49838.1 MOSC domain-containing protein [Chloroflexota bacterium]MXX82392.1 MOSC domain-containing protein [Chloroflexota bacterium]